MSFAPHLYRIAAAFGITQPVIHPLDSETFELRDSDGEFKFHIIVGPYMTVIHITSPEEISEHDWGFCDGRVLTPNRYRHGNGEPVVYKHSKRIQIAAFKLGYIFEDLESLGLEPIVGHSAIEHTLRFNEDLEVIQRHLTNRNNQP